MLINQGSIFMPFLRKIDAQIRRGYSRNLVGGNPKKQLLEGEMCKPVLWFCAGSVRLKGGTGLRRSLPHYAF